MAALLALLLVAAPDPWALREEGVACMLLLEESDRGYTLVPADHVWKGAQGPKRVPLDIDREALTACRRQISTNELDAALAALNGLLEKNAANHDARMLRGLVRYKQKKLDEALHDLRDSIIGNRRNPEAWSLLQMVAATAGKKVKRPTFELKSWVRMSGKQQVEVSHLGRDDGSTFPWMYYGVARAAYRWEGVYRREFGTGDYRFTFREQLFALGAVVKGTKMARQDKEKVASDLRVLLNKSKTSRFAPWAFFAMYPEPIPAEPERDFELLRPQLVKYFDERILVSR